MKSSKQVETCFVRANNDFDDKLTGFWMKNNFWTKIPKNGHCAGGKRIYRVKKLSCQTPSFLWFTFSGEISTIYKDLTGLSKIRMLVQRLIIQAKFYFRPLYSELKMQYIVFTFGCMPKVYYYGRSLNK